jgi:hypothetical protein
MCRMDEKQSVLVTLANDWCRITNEQSHSDFILIQTMTGPVALCRIEVDSNGEIYRTPIRRRDLRDINPR